MKKASPASGAAPHPSTGASRSGLAGRRQSQKPSTRRQKAVSLVRKWLADESGHDEANWPLAKKAIEANRTSDRLRFSD